MSKELEDSISLVRTAGEAVLNIYGRKPNTFRKRDKSVVTEADLVSHKIISDGLSKYKYGILSEEGKDDISRLQKKRVWILDPLDGTLDFLQKTSDFSIMLALVENGKLVMGVVFKPDDNKLYYAEKGEGSFLIERDAKPNRLGVSAISDISKAKYLLSRNHLSELEKKLKDSGEGERFTPMGSFGVKWGVIAEGRAEVNVNPSNRSSQWD
ncbi:3'(2'),5'-bisphosphate nucleotidase CysQ, partial [Patescibacteria group bacterium]|nr:3'(2'),5'-bisphosphate nucleotidase CysQ [Patescibacteria group bacterium]